jgi:pimeloyl-ACP methyl ester carboxylesterase
MKAVVSAGLTPVGPLLQAFFIDYLYGQKRASAQTVESYRDTFRQFHEYFAADLPAEQAAFMARSQVLNAADNFKAVITTAAWRSKPSWMLVAAADRTINPDLERWYSTRANSHKVEVAGASHSVYVSRPKEVAALIEEAAAHAQ